MNSAVVVAGNQIAAADINTLRLDLLRNAADFVTTSGSGSAYVVTLQDQLVGGDISTGFVIRCKIHAVNLAAPTIRVDDSGGTLLAAKNILLRGGESPAYGDFPAGSYQEFVYNGSDFIHKDSDVLPVGTPLLWFLKTAPRGFLLCDGSAVSRSTYAVLFSVLVPNMGTVTMTIASPCVVSLTAHGLVAGDTFYFTTSGALPTGVSANTLYYVISAGLGANSFQFSATKGGAAINSSGSQSGVHTLYYCPWGLGNGSTTFNLPPANGKVPVGFNSGDSDFGNIGQTGGEKTHTLTTAEIPSHVHRIRVNSSGLLGGSTRLFSNNAYDGTVFNSSLEDTNPEGGGGAHNNIQPYFTCNFIIKY